MKQAQIFVIQPFGKASEGVFNLIASAAANANASVFRADSINVGANIVDSIHQAIQSASLLIADVTNANPNVMYEVGFAQAQKKPLILIANSSRAIPFDLAGIRVSIYDVARPSEFLVRLSIAIQMALKDPDAFVFSPGSPERETRQNVFISYSHQETVTTLIGCLFILNLLRKKA